MTELFRAPHKESVRPTERRRATAYQRGPPPIPERHFLSQVRDLAALYRWLTYHTRDSRGSSHGFPDLVLVRTDTAPARIIFAELKSERGTTTTEQHTWLNALALVQGVEVYLWRPNDLPRIAVILSYVHRPTTIPK